MENTTINQAKEVKETKWVFVPVHKSRILKDVSLPEKKNKGYVLIQLGSNKDEEKSCILGKVFQRKKETETHIFFSIPSDYKINVRTTRYDESEHKFVVESDKLYSIGYVTGIVKQMGFALKDTEMPF